MYAHTHNFLMDHDVPKLLRAMMERLPKARQAALAERLSDRDQEVSQPQVSRWLAGQTPDLGNYNRIVAVAEELGVLGDVRSEDVAASLSVPEAPKTVKIKGYVGASSEMHFYAVSDEDFEEVEAPGATDQTVAVQIRGKSLGPLFDSWLVFYRDIRSPITPDLIGQLCVVGLTDDRIVVKRLEQRRGGGYDLASNNGDPLMEDVKIEWAARVTDLRPR